MVIKIKKLKNTSLISIRLTIEYVFKTNLNKWFTPRKMQCLILKMDVVISEEDIESVMEDLYLESLDCSWKTFVKNEVCYKCVKYS